MPSAIVSVWVAGWISPCSRDATYGAHPAASTPITRTSGRWLLTASAIPESRPPPPSGTTMASTSGTSSRISRPDRALAGDHELVVEGMDERAPVGLGVGDGRRDRVLDRVAHQADRRAVALGCPHLRERRRLGHVDRRRHAGRAGGERDRLGVVPGRRGDDARSPLRLGQRADLVVGAADLERAGLLAVLELEEDVARALARERLRPLGGGAVGDAPQRIGRGPDVVEGRHGRRRTVPRLHRPSDLG